MRISPSQQSTRSQEPVINFGTPENLVGNVFEDDVDGFHVDDDRDSDLESQRYSGDDDGIAQNEKNGLQKTKPARGKRRGSGRLEPLVGSHDLVEHSGSERQRNEHLNA